MEELNDADAKGNLSPLIKFSEAQKLTYLYGRCIFFFLNMAKTHRLDKLS